MDFLQIPITWQQVKLIDVAIVNMGQSPSSADVNNEGNGLAFFQGKAEFGKLNPEPKKFCTAPKKTAESGDILLSVRAPVGPTNVANQKTAIGRGLAAIRAESDILKPRFLLHFFRFIEPWMSQQGTGTTFRAISGAFLKELNTALPPLAEQKVIADKLDILLVQVDSTKARLERISEIFKRFRQSVLAAAVSGRLTNTDSGEWREAHLIDVIKGKPRNGHSPKGVEYKTEYRNLTLSATTSGAFLNGKFKYVDLDIDKDSHLWVRDGDILIQRANTHDYVGISAVYRGPDNFYVYPDLMMKCTANKNAVPEFLHLTLLSERVRKYFRDNATGTSGNMPKINQKTVSETPILLPSLEEQTEIVRRVDQLFAYADTVECQVNNALQRVNQLTHSILVKAFRGDLTAKWREDHPELMRCENSAEALLKKIKIKRGTKALQNGKNL